MSKVGDCETCAKFPKCGKCINYSNYEDRYDGAILIMYVLVAVMIFGVMGLGYYLIF